MLDGSLNLLYAPIEGLPSWQALVQALKAPGAQGAYGLDDSQKAHLIASVSHALKRPLLVIVPNEMAAQRMAEDLGQLTGGRAAVLPPREVSFLKAAASSKELTMQRIEALGRALTGELMALVAPVDALLHRLTDPARFLEHTITLSDQMRMDPNALIQALIDAGYERVQVVESRGQCALRGGIVDVYPVGGANALRIEFFDDEVDSLRTFDVMTQRSIDNVSGQMIYPATEMLLSAEEAEAAAERLEELLNQDASEEQTDNRQDRQREIEREFDLMPVEDFLSLTYTGDEEDELPDFDDLIAEEKPKSKAQKSNKEPKKPNKVLERPIVRSGDQRFRQALEALESGHGLDGLDALLPALVPFSGAPVDYLKDPILVFDQPERLRERCENRLLEFQELFKVALERGEALNVQAELLKSYDQLLSAADGRSALVVNTFMRTERDFQVKGLYTIAGRNATAYQGNVRELARDIKAWMEDGWKIALLSGGAARGQRLENALMQQEIASPFLEETPDALKAGEPVILPVSLNRGFVYPEAHLAVVVEGDIYGVNNSRSRTRRSSGEKISAFTELKVGDYVVHENHGIGQYMGTVQLSSDGAYRDFLLIRYTGSDKLYVPTDQLDRVQKYIGSEGQTPKLNKLSGGEWQKQKGKVRASIQQITGELVKLYAHRETAVGHAFDPDTPWQREFEDNFPFEETPDQLMAIEEIKRDMEQPRIMDRLLCGDVGYGKTEVALRAIFKAVMGGKQAALLAPTTILVQQHYATMMNRFAGFPIRVETISRFKTSAQQKKVIEQLKSGEVDVVIGTHRLLAKDIAFKDLGLLVVDEEQRFGVAHKEAIKGMKRNVDVLTLTATPIPRTLHMSMVGIRDMSLLQSPPEERYPVQTYVVEYSDGLMRDAILREMSRGGQVYVLHNRVQTIEWMFQRLKKLVPEARIAIGHGQMREHALEDVMMDFYEGKFDVLLCTTIIEAGLDVPRANTLIVCDADRFGLAQLYQLRGRVGRSNRLAYAYLTVNPNKVLTEAADKRLTAIRDFTEFGSGFRVAMRDLEIRGAGNLLGAEQSGFMASVGYDLYVKMIEEAVHEARGEVLKRDIETRMDIQVDAYLPQDYIANDLLRVEMYKKIASIDSDEAREDLIDELVDRFGNPTRPVMNLIDIALLKSIVSKIGVDNVSMKDGAIVMRISPSVQIDGQKLFQALMKRDKVLRVAGSNPPRITYQEKNVGKEALLKGAVQVMGEVVQEMEGDEALQGARKGGGNAED